MGFKRNFNRRVARERVERERKEAFKADLAHIERIEKESLERLAKSGEAPTRVTLRLDEKHHDISFAAVDRPEGRN